MSSLRYTIRMNDQIIAKVDYIHHAALIVSGSNKHFKVIDTLFGSNGRVALNTGGAKMEYHAAYEWIRASSERFAIARRKELESWAR